MSAIHSQCSSDALIVISANIEGLIAYKASILSELCKHKHCHCLCLQETHRARDHARQSTPGMTLVAERPHTKHGSSVFVRDGLKVNNISVGEEYNLCQCKPSNCCTTYHIQKTLQPEESGLGRISADLDGNIEEVDAIPENYERFVEMLRVASRKHIPSGCRSNYIPGLTDE